MLQNLTITEVLVPGPGFSQNAGQSKVETRRQARFLASTFEIVTHSSVTNRALHEMLAGAAEASQRKGDWAVHTK